jgi:hypothetical protein
MPEDEMMMELIIAVIDASHDCGEWNTSELYPPYIELLQVSRDTVSDLLKHIKDNYEKVT